MTDKEVFKRLEEKCPTGYRINELIQFYYPVRRIKMNVLVNKSPDSSLVKVYNVILRAIQLGLNTQEKLFNFLGLNKNDEFILIALKEKRYADLVSEKWSVTNAGEEFIKNEKILRIEENEDFEFFIDSISGDIMTFEESEERDVVRKIENEEKRLEQKIKFPIKSPELVNKKSSRLQLDELFKNKNKDETLISYDPNEIKNDYLEYCHYWLVEYIPENNNTSSAAKLEVRSFYTLKEIRFLTKRFNEEYQDYIYELTDSDRSNNIEELPEIVEETKVIKELQVSVPDFETLGIWETKQRFIEAIDSVKEKILIESPWIKQATREYIPYFEKLLQHKKRLIILYGMADKDEHDINIMKKLENLQTQHSKYFRLIHLPEHFENINSKLTGTHRKLMIKDNEYYISGSFNFLSFGKQENQKVSNEESHLIRKNVKEKWESVMKGYAFRI
jgi:hypothetical protein